MLSGSHGFALLMNLPFPPYPQGISKLTFLVPEYITDCQLVNTFSLHHGNVWSVKDMQHTFVFIGIISILEANYCSRIIGVLCTGIFTIPIR